MWGRVHCADPEEAEGVAVCQCSASIPSRNLYAAITYECGFYLSRILNQNGNLSRDLDVLLMMLNTILSTWSTKGVWEWEGGDGGWRLSTAEEPAVVSIGPSSAL